MVLGTCWPLFVQVLKGRNRKGLDKDQDSLTAVQDCYSTHGRTFYFTIGKTVRLSIADPHFIKDILIANTHSYIKPLHVRILGILGDGLFASSGDTWAPQRQLFNGPFHSKEVKVVSFTISSSCSEIYVRKSGPVVSFLDRSLVTKEPAGSLT